MPAVNGVLGGSTEQELKELNDYLATRAYLKGFIPSQEDAYVFKTIKSSPGQNYPHVARWYKHIQSYPEAECSSWPVRCGDGGTVASASAPAAANKEATPPAAQKAPAGGDDEFNLFGSDDEEEDEAKKKQTEERLKAYAEKKSKKPGPIAKSNVIYDVKPWDDTIDIKEIEKQVRTIQCDGLVWGTSKILPVAFGVNKLQICCCVEDDKVSTDWLEEQITSFQDIVQSVDVVAFNKV